MLGGAVIGAVIAIALREFVEWRERVEAKREACPHADADAFSTWFAGLETVHCRRCGFQRPKRGE